MITNVVMERKIGEIPVLQRTKDGMFNATAFVKAWNLNMENSTYLKNRKAKELKDFFSNKSTQEFIEALKQEPEFLHGGNSPYVNSKARADRGGGTWMHPLLFLDLAMWVNPKFKVKVLKFVQDQMIAYRKDAGDAYKELASSIKKLKSPVDMQTRMRKVADALNWLTFGASETGLRNRKATEDEQKALLDREKYLTSLINDGFIHEFEQLMGHLRRAWNKEHNPIK